MKYLSLFSGIEAVSVAVSKLPVEVVAFSEIEPFPCSLLKHRFPNVPNLGDVTRITENRIKKLGKIDLVVFGSPCQDLSIAGKREGLSGERSGLFKSAIKIIKWARKHSGLRFALWENVPGAFSSNGGEDFREVLRLFSGAKFPLQKWRNSGVVFSNECQIEWRTLDAQHFGVPQRRRRVFALADFGDWASREPILFESSSLCRDSEAGGKEGETTAVNSLRCFAGNQETSIAATIQTSSHDFSRADGFNMVVHGTQDPITSHISFPLGRNNGQENVIVFDTTPVMFEPLSPDGVPRVHENICPTLNTMGGGQRQPCLATPTQVRRLTPTECERLQGFPDGWTNVPHRGKPAADAPRYKALGNSMAVPVIRWIGERIDSVEMRVE